MTNLTYLPCPGHLDRETLEEMAAADQPWYTYPLILEGRFESEWLEDTVGLLDQE